MKLTTLKDVITDTISGEWGDEVTDGQGVGVIRAANFLNSGEINFSNLVRRAIDERKVERKKLLPGDIIIEKSGGSPTQPVGRVVIFRKPDNGIYLCNNFTSILRPNKNEVHPEFLFYVLHDNHKKGKTLRYQNKTTGIINLKLDSYLDSEIHLPPLADQIRIAYLLGNVKGLIAQRKRHLKQLDDLVKSVFLKMFGDPVLNERGWETGTSVIYADTVTVGVVVKPASHYVERGVIALRSLNIKPNRIDLSDLVYFSQKSNDGLLSKSRLKANDVVVVRTGKTGTAAVVPAALDGANCIDLIVVRPKPAKIRPQFLTCLLNSERGMALVSSLEVGGIQKHFNVGALNKIPFPLPPIELQDHFADIVEKIEGIKSRYQESLNDLETLYGALSRQAFKGELDLSRVPSTGIQAEEVKPVASEPLQLPSETGLAINLPHEYDFLDGPETPEARKALLTLWLEDCRRQLSEPFTVQNFMAAALTRMEELEPEFDCAFNVSDYEYIKVWVFGALAAGTLTQAFNDAGNRIEVKAVQA